MKKLHASRKVAKLYIDQYGGRIYARTRKELVEQAGGGKVSIMYCDGIDGKTYKVGYVVGRRWFTVYVPERIPV